MNLTDISPAIALTPLDGRYRSQTAPLVEYLSEPALNRERMRVEVGAGVPALHPRGVRRRRHRTPRGA